jgi:hypothetical protein
LNEKLERLNVSCAAADTVIVTATVREPEAAFMEIVPRHVVPAAIPDGLTETVKTVPAVPAVKLPLGERVSQVLLPQLCSDTWAEELVSNGAVTVTV